MTCRKSTTMLPFRANSRPAGPANDFPSRNRDKRDKMPPRNQSTDKCAQCRIYRPLCLCGDIVPLILDTRVTLYMHWRERLRTTNTGWLACLALPNSEIRTLDGLYVQTHRQSLDLTQMKPVIGNIRVKDVSVICGGE